MRAARATTGDDAAMTRPSWRATQDPSLRRLRVMQQLQERARLRSLDSSAIDKKVRQAQADVDRIRDGIWRRHWAVRYAIAIQWARARS